MRPRKEKLKEADRHALAAYARVNETDEVREKLSPKGAIESSKKD